MMGGFFAHNTPNLCCQMHPKLQKYGFSEKDINQNAIKVNFGKLTVQNVSRLFSEIFLVKNGHNVVSKVNLILSL